MWDSVPSKYVPTLIIRVSQSILSMFCIYQAIKALPLIIVNLVTNTMPLITVVLGHFVLHESISRLEKISLFVAFAGVTTLLFF